MLINKQFHWIYHKKCTKWELKVDAFDIKNKAWVTVNNDFFDHEWGDLPMIFTSDEVTSENHWQITSRVTKKIVIHGNECIILFLTRCFISWTHRSAKQSSIVHFTIVARDDLFWLNIVTSSQLICDVTRTRGTGIVTSYSSIVLARANWRKCDLHKWITTVNIDFSPPGIHSLACKKLEAFTDVWWSRVSTCLQHVLVMIHNLLSLMLSFY